jgi:hypothetical protein
MKRYLLLALAAFAFVIVAPSAMAVRVRVVDAPAVPLEPSASTDCTLLSAINPNAACPISDINATYKMSFVDVAKPGCQAAAGVAGVGPAGIAGFNFCIILQNVTQPNVPLTGFNFTFIVPDAGLGDDYSFIDCSGVPSNVTNSFCPSAPLIVGSSITVSFAANPGVPVPEVAYLFVDFANNPGNASVTVSGPISVPEPGELGLFGLGLLGICVGYGWEKRRQSHRIKSAA